jgi:hypothetical protein
VRLGVTSTVAIAEVFPGWSVSCCCASHPSGLGSDPKSDFRWFDPFRRPADQKTFDTMPCPNGVSGVVVVNQPKVAHDMGSNDTNDEVR